MLCLPTATHNIMWYKLIYYYWYLFSYEFIFNNSNSTNLVTVKHM